MSEDLCPPPPDKPFSASPRRIAFDAVHAARVRGSYVKELLEKDPRMNALDDSDRRFCLLIACGAVAARECLDGIIDRNLAKRSDAGNRLRDALCISVFEMAYLKKEAYAAVSQGVELVKQTSPKASKLANALLRRVSESLMSFPWGDPDSSIEALAMQTGSPLWLTRMIADERGFARARLALEATLSPCPTYASFLGSSHDALASGYAIPDLSTLNSCYETFGSFGNKEDAKQQATFENPVTTILLDHEDIRVDCGLGLVISDASAQQVALLATPVGKKRLLEIGAGRGTKTMLIKQRNPGCLIDAVELKATRCKALRNRLDESEISGVNVICADARKLECSCLSAPEYDCVLVDAPCSGSGTLRRHPEICMRLHENDLFDLTEIQSAMLLRASAFVAPKGRLVYSTCSVFNSENVGVIRRFLDENPAFVVGQVFSSLQEPNGPDGHYACVLKKASDG